MPINTLLNKKILSSTILSLLSNAKDAILKKEGVEGSIKGEIIIEDYPIYDDWFAINVTDNGIGIDDSIKDRIFEPYFTTKFKNKDVGLGLYLTKVYVEDKMGGKLHFESLNNRTKFVIALPIKKGFDIS